MIVLQIVYGNELRFECVQVHRALQHVAYIVLVRLECHWLRHSVSRKELRWVPAFDVLHGFAGKSEMLYLHAQMQFPYRLYTLIALRLHAGPVKPAFIIFVQHQIGEPAQRRIEDGDRKSTRLNSSHSCASRMPSSA